MFQRNALIITILMVVLVFVPILQAQERPEGGPPVFEPERARPVGPEQGVARIRECAEQLRARAREAQELADRLRRDAEGLEQMVRQVARQGITPGPMNPVRRELAEIREAVGRAEREGQPERAADLRSRAEQLMGEIRGREPKAQMDERGLPDVRERIEQLQNQAREAEAGGRPEQARELREQAQDLEMKMRHEIEIGRMSKRIEAMRGEAAELRQRSEQADRDGRREEAKAQWEEAGNIEREIGEAQRKVERFKAEAKLKHLHMMIGRAQKRGDHEKAEALARDARELEQRLQGSQAGEGDLPRMVEELRREVMGLRQEVEELRRQVADRGPR
jgi:tetratricopeptide (TPR) repeat protein